MIERLVSLILYSLFIQGYRGVRRGSIIAPLVLNTLYVLGLVNPAALAVSIIVVYLSTGMTLLAVYASAVALIPAAWMSITQLILDSLHGVFNPSTYLAIGLKSYAVSIAALYTLHSLNPLEAGYIVYRLTGSCPASYIPSFLQKVLGQVLREGLEATVSHRLKGVGSWRTLALLLVRADELTTSIGEATTLRLKWCRPRLWYDNRILGLQVLGIGLALALTMLARQLL